MAHMRYDEAQEEFSLEASGAVSRVVNWAWPTENGGFRV